MHGITYTFMNELIYSCTQLKYIGQMLRFIFQPLYVIINEFIESITQKNW